MSQGMSSCALDLGPARQSEQCTGRRRERRADLARNALRRFLSVASAAASAETLAAARGFLAEIDVLVGGHLDGVADDLHVGPREHVAIPRLDAGAAGEAADDRQDREHTVRLFVAFTMSPENVD